MQNAFGGALRRLILAATFGAVLVALAPDTGSVSAHQAVVSERIGTAHLLTGAN